MSDFNSLSYEDQQLALSLLRLHRLDRWKNDSLSFSIFSHRFNTQAVKLPGSFIFIIFNYWGVATHRVDTSTYDHWQDVQYNKLEVTDKEFLNRYGLKYIPEKLTDEYKELLLSYGFKM